MKILFACGMLPCVARHLGLNDSTVGGWVAGLSEGLLTCPDIELAAMFPHCGSDAIISGKADGIAYYGFPYCDPDARRYNKKIELYAETIINAVQPDVVHIFGTESPYALAVVNACEKLGIIGRVLINIQGLVSVIARHYFAGLPGRAVNRYTLRDFIKQDNIRQQAKTFAGRGKFEIEAIKKARHVSGRTQWDRACAQMINPDARYHFCYEILRDEFYKHSWDIAKCERNSIFMSQAYYPLKGLHIMLEAMPEIIKRFPGTHLYVAGIDITRRSMPLARRLLIDYYGVYIKKQIERNKLREHVTFTGMLNENEMCKRFLQSHVFVSASSIENESNSVSEAKILGVPVISSFAGGTTERLKHCETGFYYQHDAPYMLAHYVCRIFGDDALAVEFSQKAKAHARDINDREKNTKTMVEIYENIQADKNSNPPDKRRGL